MAGLLNVDVKNLTNADLFKYIKEHSDLFDRPDSAFGPVDNGMADALIGGAGNDILYGQPRHPTAMRRLILTTGNAAPLFFFHDRVQCEAVDISFTNALCLACQNTGKAQQTA